MRIINDALANNQMITNGSILPLYVTSPGSGSHSPLLMHIDKFGPVSTSLEGQENPIFTYDKPETIVADFKLLF